MYKVYRVREGETISSIANNIGVPMDVLITLNGINTNTNLKEGDYIIIPSSNTQFSYYTVKKGDNLYALGQKYGTTAKQLEKLNGINESDYIYPGEQIMVPNQNTRFYVTEENDTLKKVTNFFRVPATEIERQNETIYLLPDQLITYRING